jgi:hypothetical protein
MEEASARITRTSGMNPWRAGCGESRTSGSEGGPGRRSGRKTGTAPWPDPYTTFPTLAGDYHLIPVLDRCSRKITGRHFGPEGTSACVQTAWGKALASEGLLAEEGPALPSAHSDRARR